MKTFILMFLLGICSNLCFAGSDLFVCGGDDNFFLLKSEKSDRNSGRFELRKDSAVILWKGKQGKGFVKFSDIKNISYVIEPNFELGMVSIKTGFFDEVTISNVPSKCFFDFLGVLKNIQTR